MSTIAVEIFGSPAYRELSLAVKAHDHARQAAIIEAEIARLTGVEKAMWIGMRAGRKLRQSFPLLGSVWADLQEALRVGGDSREVRTSVLSGAVALGLLHERIGCVWLHLRTMPDLRALLRTWDTQSLMGYLAIRRGRWAAAYRWLAAAERSFRRLPMDHQTSFRGVLVNIIAWRAVAAFASGRAEQGEMDVHAMEMLLPYSVAAADPKLVALSRAERAFHHGDYQTARAALQWATARGDSYGSYGGKRPNDKIMLDLMAARIARAEGNAAAFAHFCARAEQLIAYHDLPLLRLRIEAVKSGAPR